MSAPIWPCGIQKVEQFRRSANIDDHDLYPHTRMSYNLEKKSSNKCYGGEVRKYTFKSKALGNLDANFNIFLPPSAVGSKATKVPILYYLAGLTCTEDNGAQKGNFHERAAKEEIAIVYPDTSPRGAKIEGEDESYDFGSGEFEFSTHDCFSDHSCNRRWLLYQCNKSTMEQALQHVRSHRQRASGSIEDKRSARGE